MTTRTLVVVSAGLSVPSSTRLLADRLAAATVAAAGRAAGDAMPVEVTHVELRELAHDITDHLLTGFAPAALRRALDAVAAADGLIAVTPIFNASYSGLFKSFTDVLDRTALDGTPVLLAATGGTARHSLALDHALRPLFAYLRAAVVPTGVFAATEDFAGGALRARIDRAAAELADAMARREPAAPADPFALTTDFAALLAGD
ncbi:CE1759 family FMN reductase [Spirilliplanes yamanashiensis]|uniref:Oxidoreductase n=1 Tax=Spirilliplanes yamanashiensis TaxID=42233 RepID=A0A8J3Y9A5_9ACTN|nr:CE1759 family FMN reductase [Spirilliplanes yamanashiensis]MDP9817561.1 FMN reductase [Spirilliplanes yamanashiensis]GIJ04371.1 oxidoreductase [Spirilliplanes yamanashiensis]